jgi:anti-sigma factor RsiW
MSGARTPPGDEIACARLVNLITEYLEDALPDELRERVDRHLASCEGCRHAMTQWRAVIRLVGQLTIADIERVDDYTRQRLAATFHRLHPR